MKFRSILLMTVSLSFCVNAAEEKPLGWKELSDQFECPAWYSEAKFGIWAHWGAQTQPENGGGWYARHMYQPDVGWQTWGKDAYEYHNKNYGHPSEKGFKDVIHEWKAENLDTDALLKYFKGIGAKYFVAMANHHDHFDNFDSTYHPWNSVNVGPKKDIIGEFATSARKYGVPFGVSSHDDRFLRWWLPAFGSDKSGPKKGVPYDGRMTKEDGKGKWWEGLDPADLYGLPPEKRTDEWITELKETWVLRHKELVEKYDVDMLWFDGNGFPYGKYGKEVCQALYNQSLKKHGKIKAVVVGKIRNEPATISDVEKGVANEILPRTWQSITTFRTWFYKQDKHKVYMHNARTIIEVLADVISKNGNLLLNVELLPDGTIPPEQKPIFDDIGAWVNLNAEAIYASKPWKVYGDNLNSSLALIEKKNISEADLAAIKKKSCQYNERTLKSLPYGPEEVRFTTKGSRLFVFVLNPSAGRIKLPALGLDSPQKPKVIKSIRMIGNKQKIDFNQKADVLELTVPANLPTKYTVVFEVTWKDQ